MMSSSVLALNTGLFFGSVVSCGSGGSTEEISRIGGSKMPNIARGEMKKGVDSDVYDDMSSLLEAKDETAKVAEEASEQGRRSSLGGPDEGISKASSQGRKADIVEVEAPKEKKDDVRPSREAWTQWKMASYQRHRLRLYRQLAMDLQSPADAQFFYLMMMWCHDKGIFIHPCVRGRRSYSPFRDHQFYVTDKVRRLTPLLAVPESLLIGFQPLDAQNREDRNNLYDEKKEEEFNRLNAGESSAADICSFFFSSLSMMVSDLVTARGSPLTDARHVFAEMLSKVRTLQNAPYFDNDVVLDRSSEEMGLADVLLQMIRNYVNAGPLVNKVSREDLLWLVSVCLSHSTPLTLGPHASIGIVPILHLFPHGGKHTNSFVVARRTEGSHLKMANFIRRQCGLDFSHDYDGRWVYLVAERDLSPGEEVLVQAMAPACDADVEADQMWRLSCGATPDHYLTSQEVERKRRELQDEMVQRGAIQQMKKKK